MEYIKVKSIRIEDTPKGGVYITRLMDKERLLNCPLDNTIIASSFKSPDSAPDSSYCASLESYSSDYANLGLCSLNCASLGYYEDVILSHSDGYCFFKVRCMRGAFAYQCRLESVILFGKKVEE